jgi:hypothetical protein
LNRLDFISFLLPGYTAIIAYLVVFQSRIFFADSGVSIDLLTAIVFIVAGPALGLTLAQLHRGAVSVYEKIKSRNDYTKYYAEFCLKMSDNEKVKLEEAEAYYDFSISTGLALLGLSVLGFVSFGLSRFEPLIFLVGGIILLISGYLEWTDTYSPIYDVLSQKYTPRSVP